MQKFGGFMTSDNQKTQSLNDGAVAAVQNSTAESVIYTRDAVQVMCTVIITQKNAQEDSVVVESPGDAVSPKLYDLANLHTSFKFVVSDLHGGMLQDYVNAIALCIIKHGLTTRVPVAAERDGSLLICVPTENKVLEFVSDGSDVVVKLKSLFDECKEKHSELIHM
ncbi:hypothetical protein ENBRE01_0588 [Enteropsectra breve]|nr:hypothetical protein ENBRE01_0588 [Enteropsectra breve]